MKTISNELNVEESLTKTHRSMTETSWMSKLPLSQIFNMSINNISERGVIWEDNSILIEEPGRLHEAQENQNKAEPGSCPA